ncbi:MAG: hypothetical protein B6U65_03430 [Candidatus Wolframiiraptor sp. EX4484-121]|nr:MAG: hypothetical protein B6U65_03430 [Candidatus Wolframiiraptor sp. EX4484-121]
MLQFRRLRKSEVVKRLREIASMEGIKVTDAALKKLAERSEGDLRSAINDLQAIASGRKIVDVDAVEALGERNRVREIFQALRIIFNTKSLRAARAALEGLEIDLDMVYAWLIENVPEQIPDPGELAEAYEALARADLFLAKASREQKWKLTRYAIPLMTGGVALARRTKPHGFVKFTFPSKIRLMQRSRAERELRSSIASKIAGKLHLSSSKAIAHMLPYISFIMSRGDEYAKAMAEYFEFTPSEVKYLAGGGEVEVAEVAVKKRRRGRRTRRR